jgi:hypothetical protein
MPVVTIWTRANCAEKWAPEAMNLPDVAADAMASLGGGANGVAMSPCLSIDPQGSVPLEAGSLLSEITSAVPVYLCGVFSTETPALSEKPPAEVEEDPLAFASPEAREEAAKTREEVLAEWRQCVPASEYDAQREADSWRELTTAQRRALVHCRRNAAILSRKCRDAFEARVRGVFDVEALFAWFGCRARITVNVDLLHNLEKIVRSRGEYHSVFEAELGAGGKNRGGKGADYIGRRALWERKIFGPAYGEAYTPKGKKFGEDSSKICAHAERPKCGALNFTNNARGAAPNYGGSFFELAQHVRCRTTFTYADSQSKTIYDIGTSDHMCTVLASLTDRQLRAAHQSARLGTCQASSQYIEAQIHGRLLVQRDVARVMLSPCDDNAVVRRALDALGVPYERQQR